MKKIILFFLSFILSSLTNELVGCGMGQTNFHWGTKANTLRGVTLTWLNSTWNDSIRWGYTSNYERGRYPGERRLADAPHSKNIQYWYDYQFPILKPSTILHYSIKSEKKWGKDRIFNTAVDTASEQFTFVVGGDSQKNMKRWKKMAEKIVVEEIDFFIILGDAVQDGNVWHQWQDWYKFGSKLVENEIVFHTWGNHDFNEMIAINNVVLPENEKWYAFEQGNALFICLLTEQDFDVQFQWLLDQLDTSNKEWIIVYFHRPFFTRGKHADEMNPHRQTWWKAFDDYGVDIVMSGHTHSYIRTRPLNLNVSDHDAVLEYGSQPHQGRLEFVSGGLGGKNSKPCNEWFAARAYSGLHFIKFKINGDKLHFDTISETGQLIDSLTLHSNGTPFSLEKSKLPERGICAHRGANDTHPENTLAAFREAIRLGAHMIEFDVQITKDGELVIMHDETVDRTTNGTGKVVDLTFEELRKLDAGSWKDAKFAGEKVPTLSETLDIMPRNVWLNIHIKDGAEIGREVAKLILSKNRRHQAIVACKKDAARAVKNFDSEIKICNMDRQNNSEQYVQETIDMKSDFIQLKDRADENLADHVNRLKEHHIKINYYGTNSPEKLEMLFSTGVEFPLVDKLAEMMEVAKELGIHPVKPEY